MKAQMDSCAFYENFFSISLDMLCIADLQGYLRKVNPMWHKILGWSDKELCAQPFIDFVHPDDLEDTLKATATLGEGGRVVGFENRYRTKNGEYKWLQWNSTVMPEEGLIYAVARDITETRQLLTYAKQTEDVSGVGSWEIDISSKTLYWSPMTHRIHETDVEQYKPKLEDGLQFFPSEALTILKPAVEKLMTDGTPYDLCVPFLTAKGKHLWVRATAKAIIRNKKVFRTFGTFQDITSTKEFEDALLKKNAELNELREALDQSSMVSVTDTDGTILRVNRQYIEMTQYSETELVGSSHRIVNSGYHPKEFWTHLWQTIQQGKVWRGEVKNKKKDGTFYWAYTTIKPIFDHKNELVNYIAIRQDITERKRLEDELRQQAISDPLTGLFNRRHFMEDLDREYGRFTRYNQPVHVLMVDIDHFKSINDHYGHATGDLVLKQVAHTLSQSFRTTDSVARIGGEEFAILFIGGERVQALEAAERARIAIESLIIKSGANTVRVTASFGMDCFVKEDLEGQMALNRADQALYNAKQYGRNRIELLNGSLI